MTQRSLQSLRSDLKRYSLESAIELAGALQLVPVNTEHAVRLEMLALVAATTKNGSLKPFPARSVEELVRDSWLSEMAQYEEPAPGPFVETVTFHGGGYRIFHGPNTDSTYVLRSFLEIFLDEHLVRDYSRFAVGLLTGALSISELVAGRAGLARTVRPTDGTDDLEIPDGATLAHLRAAVSFSAQEVEAYLATRSMTLSALAPLVTGIGNVPGVLEIERNPLRSTPIVQAKGRLIVAIPSALHTAAVHHALVESDRRGLNARVSKRLLEFAWRTVNESVQRMDWAPTLLTPPSPLALPNSRDAVFQFDGDKLAYVILLCDPLDSYTASPSRASFDNEALTSRLVEVERWIGELEPTPSDLLIVITVAGVGRSCSVRLVPDVLLYSSVLVVSASDLETMSLLERDPLGLWKFQRAARILRETTEVGPSLDGPLNEFWYYLDREHSYYFSEEAVPSFVMFDGAGACRARQDVAMTEDRHAIVGPSPTTIVEVTRSNITGPVYARRKRNVPREFCICTSTIPIWIVSAAEHDANGHRAADGPVEDNGAIHLACRAMAFWAAELLNQTEPQIAACAKQHRLLVRIDFDNLDAFETRSKAEPEGPMVRLGVDRAHGSMLLTLTDVFAWNAASRDNRAERAMVFEYLRGLNCLSASDEEGAETGPIQALVDEIAPLGFKKQITLTEMIDEPQLDPRALPSLRLVQRADEQLLMDTLGRRVIDSMKLPAGDLDQTNAHDVLHRTVSELYGELQRRVAALSPVGLVESLLAANESVVLKEAEKASTLAARIACAQSSEEMLTEVEHESTASAETAIAMRFLVEYVAARPPRGVRRLSGSVMDELVAMASMLVFLGTVSDVAEFKIASVRVAVLASRRIHVDSGEFNVAMQSYLSITTGRDLDRARGERQRSRVPDIAGHLKIAIASEFGVSSEQARSAIAALYEIGVAQNPSVAVFERSSIEEAVAKRTGLDVQQVRSMLEKLTLSARPDFLRPTNPFEKHDVYPWRFGRGLSLLQRPLILRTGDNREQLTWGARQLWGSWRHVGYRMAHGSWRAPNDATKKALSAINDARGYVFEGEVADALRQQRPELSVRERVMKLGGRKIHVGDIDVLVAARASKNLWLLECKDLSRATTPWSIKHQIEDLFVDRPNEKAIQTKHEARIKWARDHVTELLQLVEETGDAWEVRGAIVTAAELVAPLLASARMPVISWQQLADFEF